MSEEGNCSFNESVSIILKGDVEPGTLKLAILEGIQRLEALRSTFSPDGSNF
jgi:hypothetical protein